MVIQRGEIWWADIPSDGGSGTAYRRPVLIVQSDTFNRSRIGTVVAVSLTSKLALGDAFGNVKLSRKESGLSKDSVVNVSQIVTLDKAHLDSRVGRLSARTMAQIELGLRLVLEL